MPAVYVHQSVARSAAADLGQTRAYAQAPLLALGAQGPDVLFYYRVLSPWNDRRLNRAGETMHQQRTGDMLRAVLRHARGGGAGARALALGWISHCAVDGALHPYVYAYSARHANGYTRAFVHMMLEQALDVWHYREKGGVIPLRQFDFFDRLGKEELEIYSGLLSRAVSDVWPETKLTVYQACQACRDMNQALRWLYSPHGRRYRTFQALEKALGRPGLITSHAAPPSLPANDFLNRARQPWEDPWRMTRRTESLPDLLAAARERTLEWFRNAAAYFEGVLPLEEAVRSIGDPDYRSGLPCGSHP